MVISAIHSWRLLDRAGLSFSARALRSRAPIPTTRPRPHALELYAAAPPVISFDQIGPISLKPIEGIGWARCGRPERLRATYNRRQGIRYMLGAPDVHRDRLYARTRPRRAGSDVPGFMRTIRLVYPARQRIY